MAVLLIVGTEKGAFLCRSNRERTRWTLEGPLFKGWKATASVRTATGRFLLATTSQVYGAAVHASTDLTTWRQIERGPAYPTGGDRKLNQIWTLRGHGRRLFAGVDEAGLFSSDDEGDSWHPVSGLNDHPSRRSWFPGAGGLCAHAILTNDQRPDQIWCGISAVGAWRSDDGGHTWTPKNEGVRCLAPDKDFPGIGYCVHGLAQDPDDPDVIYRQDHSGMYRSRDGGDTWQKNETGLPSWFGFAIAMHSPSRTLFSFPLQSDEYRLPVDGKCRVYRSRTRGDSWEPAGAGLPETYYGSVLRGGMAVDGLEPAGVYVGSTSGDLFVTADAGETWQTLSFRLPRVLSVGAYVEADA
jgi:BNR/Asp-box repeat